MEYKQFKTKVGGKEVVVEVGKFCMQTNGHCIVRCGETAVMVNTTMSETVREGIDFFPLSVDFEEKMYSVGKIPGGFKRREGRASDHAILVSRLIDRPIRPLFPKGMYNDVTVIATALSVDPQIQPEPYAMLGSSIALTISDIPFEGPTGSVCVGCVNGKYVINPTEDEKEKSTMNVTVSGTKDAVLMVEAGAKEVSEAEMIEAIQVAHEEIKKLCDFQLKIQKAVGKKKSTKVKLMFASGELRKEIEDIAVKPLEKAFTHFDRAEREELEAEVDELVKEKLGDRYDENKTLVMDVMKNIKKHIVRDKIVDKGIRPDGRKTKEIRPIWCDVGFLPRVHGSAVFTRGLTQVMTTTTLGMLSDMQKLEGLDDEAEKRYMHHYNMPGYASGEARPLKAAGRREIGHGALAERALEPVLPSEEEFPYAIRTVSEVLSSNGSTSQASVCGSTLSLMDAGVPIKAPVAGIAMGLIKDEQKGKVVVLSDIQGIEDFYGDMDFKVAGTEKGITAIQMDIKIKGIDKNILTTALNQAQEGRMHILGIMLKTLKAPRKEISKYAPKIITFQIDPDKIRDVIGTGGKVINKIIEETGVQIEIKDEGDVYIATPDTKMAERAKEIIMLIANDPKPGDKITGTVNKIAQFGAFVELVPGKDGMIHISKLSNKRVNKVEDVVKVGDKVQVEVIKVDEKGRIDLKLLKVVK